MEVPAKRLLRTAPPPLTLPASQQPVPVTPPPSPTGARAPPTSPAEPRIPPAPPTSPRAPPPSPASPRAPPPSPHGAPTPPPSQHGALTPPPSPVGAPTPPPSPEASLMLAPPHKVQVYKQEKLRLFGHKQKHDFRLSINFNSRHEASLDRVGRMVKSDYSVTRVAGEIRALSRRTCKMFISKLALCGWFNAGKHNCQTLHTSDISLAMNYADTHDFLVHGFPWNCNIEVKTTRKGSGMTTGNTNYHNENAGTRNADVRSNSDIIGGIGIGIGIGCFYGIVGGAIANLDASWRIPGMMMGLSNAGTKINVGNFSTDAGTSDWVAMRNNSMLSQSFGLFVPVYAHYDFLPYQVPNEEENADELMI